MAHEVLPGKHPDMLILRFYGDIETDDIITSAAELHLDEGHAKYILADINAVSPGVPERLWERVRESIIYHKNLAHLAIYIKSSALRVLIVAFMKVTRKADRVSLHQTYEQAEAHLIHLIETQTSNG